MITNAFQAETVKKSRRGKGEIHLPVAIQHYNQSMGGVDKMDQIIQPYSAARKTRR